MARGAFTASLALLKNKCVIYSLYCRIKQANNKYDRRDDISFRSNEVTNGRKTYLCNETSVK